MFTRCDRVTKKLLDIATIWHLSQVTKWHIQATLHTLPSCAICY